MLCFNDFLKLNFLSYFLGQNDLKYISKRSLKLFNEVSVCALLSLKHFHSALLLVSNYSLKLLFNEGCSSCENDVKFDHCCCLFLCLL